MMPGKKVLKHWTSGQEPEQEERRFHQFRPRC